LVADNIGKVWRGSCMHSITDTFSERSIMNRNKSTQSRTICVPCNTSGFNEPPSASKKEDLNAKLLELQNAHKGMHPVILTVLAALRGLSESKETLYENIQS
jgi:hypothetical protein